VRKYFPDNFECDPLSPPEGEAAQGERPLDPLFSGVFPETFFRAIAPWGMPTRRGWRRESAVTPKSVKSS